MERMERMTLKEFNAEAARLPQANGEWMLVGEVIATEPLEGRSTLDVVRRCIVEIDGKRFVSRWD